VYRLERRRTLFFDILHLSRRVPLSGVRGACNCSRQQALPQARPACACPCTRLTACWGVEGSEITAMASPPRKGFGNDASSRGGKLDIPPGLLDTLSKLAAGGKVGPEGLSPVRVGPSSSYRASPDRSLQSSTLGSSSKAAGGTPPAGARDPNQLLHATLKVRQLGPAAYAYASLSCSANQHAHSKPHHTGAQRTQTCCTMHHVQYSTRVVHLDAYRVL
jgi:hypothetical protein